MLKQLFHVFVFSFLFCSSAFGQCKSILTDTLCPLQNYTYVGNKDFKSIDFCPNRLDSLVFINSLPTYAARQIKVLKTKGKYYLINPDYGTSVMRNYEFNSDFTVLLNANYTVLPTNDTCYYSTAYEMAPLDTVRWVGFKADVAFNHLYKIAFDSITDPTPEFTYIGDFNLSAAYMMRIYGKYLFLTNSGTNSITRILFNDDFSAVLNSDIIVGDFYTPIGIDIVFDCSTGNYFGFVANNATGTLSRIDFGTSLATANPTVMALSTNVGFARGLKVYNQENVWYTITNTFPENKLKVWQIGAITDTVFTAVFDTSTSPIGWGVEILVDSSRLHIFSSLQPTHYQFQGCLLNNTWFENTDSVNLSYYLSDTG